MILHKGKRPVLDDVKQLGLGLGLGLGLALALGFDS